MILSSPPPQVGQCWISQRGTTKSPVVDVASWPTAASRTADSNDRCHANSDHRTRPGQHASMSDHRRHPGLVERRRGGMRNRVRVPTAAPRSATPLYQLLAWRPQRTALGRDGLRVRSRYCGRSKYHHTSAAAGETWSVSQKVSMPRAARTGYLAMRKPRTAAAGRDRRTPAASGEGDCDERSARAVSGGRPRQRRSGR